MNRKAKQSPTRTLPEVTVTAIKAEKTAELQSNAQMPEDNFAGMYLAADGTGSVIAPPYCPTRLQTLVNENNTLGQCVSAMEVNIDGTGFVIERKDNTTKEKDVEADRLTSFLKQPYPGKSFVSIRRLLRRDIESCGWGTLEVIRNAKGELMFINHVFANTMRLVKLGNPVVVPKKVNRNGVDVTVNMAVRERVFVQKLDGLNTPMYFKEYGASRDLDKMTGQWAEPGKRLPANRRATEILYFTKTPDVRTPYGVPCWVNQLPSVLGSRKAEEYNLEFFDSGGIPPVLVFLAGGALSKETRTTLEQIFTAKHKTKARGAVVEVAPTGGSLDSSAKADVKVERFGAERQNDSMFENYDSKCEGRVRSAFRLPPMFIGKAEDYSFATAYTSYTLAEAQVFQPEREEFDTIINTTIMAELSSDYVLRSLPMSIKDIENQLKALELVLKTNAVTAEDFVASLNEATNLKLKYSDPSTNPILLTALQVQQHNPGANLTGAQHENQVTLPGQQPVAKADPMGVLELANDWLRIAGSFKGRAPATDALFIETTKQAVSKLSDSEKELFYNLVLTKTMPGMDKAYEGMLEAGGCAITLLN